MNYRTGEPVKIGDSVSLEHGKTAGIVHALIESAEQIREWSLSEPGVMVESEPFGLVFWPSSEANDPLIFIARKYT